MLIDTHCHLKKEDLDIILNDIKNSDIDKIIISGYDPESNKEAIILAEQYDFVYASIGFHPDYANDIKEDDYILLEEQLHCKKVVGLGEIGLDYYWYKDNKEQQIKMFKKQLSIAERFNKPVIVHNREASRDIYDNLISFKVRGILHCFNGTIEEARQYIKLGYFLGIGGIITFKNAQKLQMIIKEIPLEYIVLETDAPYLTPEPFRGKKNNPLLIKYTAFKIADIKEVPYNEVGLKTSENVVHLFDL